MKNPTKLEKHWSGTALHLFFSLEYLGRACIGAKDCSDKFLPSEVDNKTNSSEHVLTYQSKLIVWFLEAPL
jgi:hypothetical protein